MVENESDSFHYNPWESPQKFLFPLLIIYCFNSLEVLVPNGEILLQGHSDGFNELEIEKTILLLV